MADSVCVSPRGTYSALPLPGPSVRGSQQPCSNRTGRRMALGPEIHHPQLLFNKEDHHIEAITSQILPEASRTGNNLLEADNKVMDESIVGAGEGRDWLQRAPDDSKVRPTSQVNPCPLRETTTAPARSVTPQESQCHGGEHLQVS